jgi:hypothetical protein
MPEQGVENRIMIDAQKVLFAKVKNQNIAHLFLNGVICKECVPEGTAVPLNPP